MAKKKVPVRCDFGGLLDETVVRITLSSGETVDNTWRQFVISCSLRDQDIEECVAAFDKGEKAVVRGHTVECVRMRRKPPTSTYDVYNEGGGLAGSTRATSEMAAYVDLFGEIPDNCGTVRADSDLVALTKGNTTFFVRKRQGQLAQH
jgi:hypothetical protein